MEIPETLSSGSTETPAEEPVLPPSDAASSGTGEAAEDAPKKETPQETGSPISGAVAGAIGGAVILAVILAAVLLRRKKPAPPPAAEQSGIYMRLEVLEGTLTSTRTEFNLTDELLVGRDAGCDIAFDSPVLSRRHTRIFWDGTAVQIQDLGSQNGTSVNGAAVTEPRILRSGDEITAGDVRFRLKF